MLYLFVHYFTFKPSDLNDEDIRSSKNAKWVGPTLNSLEDLIQLGSAEEILRSCTSNQSQVSVFRNVLDPLKILNILKILKKIYS